MPRNSRSDAENTLLIPRWKSQPTIVTVNASSNRNGSDLAAGVYIVVSDTACHYRQGSATINATTSDHYMPAGDQRLISVEEDSDTRIAVIQVSSSGSLYIHKAHE